jgi:hypothetical protein
MLNKHIVQEQEEQIRKQVRELSDPQRLEYYKTVSSKIKDPDSYATLNYIVIAGLHHFYLGRWLLGLINISVFTAGATMIYFHQIELGVAFIVGIVLFELYELMRSQIIVQDHNNTMSQEALRCIVESDQDVNLTP